MPLNIQLEVCYKVLTAQNNDKGLVPVSTRIRCKELMEDYSGNGVKLLKGLDDDDKIVAIINSVHIEWIQPFIPPTRRYRYKKARKS